MADTRSPSLCMYVRIPLTLASHQPVWKVGACSEHVVGQSSHYCTVGGCNGEEMHGPETLTDREISRSYGHCNRVFEGMRKKGRPTLALIHSVG
jgi:hypothetical protein